MFTDLSLLRMYFLRLDQVLVGLTDRGQTISLVTAWIPVWLNMSPKSGIQESQHFTKIPRAQGLAHVVSA